MRFSKLKGLEDRVMQIETAVFMYLCVSVVTPNHCNHKYPQSSVILYSSYETGTQINGR